MFRFLGWFAVIAFVFVAQMSSSASAACTSMTTITSIPQLQKIGSSATALAGTWCLGKKIAANGMTIAPIGTSTAPFTGTFDGKGYTIDGLVISGTGTYIGLFAYLGNGGSISNLGLTNLSVSAPSGFDVGGLVGRNLGTIFNSFTTGSVSGTAGDSFNGIAVCGVAGWNFGTISFAYSDASITSPGTLADLGGISGGYDGTILYSHSVGTVGGVAGPNFDHFSLGGLVGRNRATGSIKQSYATGTINARGSNVAGGGLVGVSNGGTVLQSFATGPVHGGSSGYYGGLVGYMDSGGSISASFATGNVDANNSGFAGGLVGQLINSTLLQTYATGAVGAGSNGQAAGLVAWGSGSTISQSYAIGRVTGSTVLSGGLVGPSINSPTVTNSYWDVQTSGQSNVGGGGLPSPPAALKGVIPVGFDQNVWKSRNDVNNFYPYFPLTCPLRIECDVIEKNEGLELTAYMPNLSSGVTISQGADLGRTTDISQSNLLDILGNTKIYQVLSSVRTHSGQDALNIMKSNGYSCSPISSNSSECFFSGVNITLPQAQMLFTDAADAKLNSLDNNDYGLAVEWPLSTKSYPASPYPQFFDLPPEAQTVLFDLHYVGLLVYSESFWMDMIKTQWQSAVSDLIKLANSNTKGYKSRILGDEALLQKLATRCQPQTSCQ